MKLRVPRGFTLIEVIATILILVVLAGLVVATDGRRAESRTQATAEIRMLSAACQAYAIDTGSAPRNEDTDKLDPRIDMVPTAGAYQRANLHLYAALAGDFVPIGAPDGKPETGVTRYVDLPRSMLNYFKDSTGGIAAVKSIQDPYGHAYGYSTAQRQQEEGYRKELQSNPTKARPAELKGYNPSFDLWSTGGGTATAHKAKWTTNWGE